MKTCGLYFGSFNPFHIGHLAIVNYLVSYTDLDEVQIVLSPLNPLKEGIIPADDPPAKRLQHIRNVLEARRFQVQVSDIEFTLPKPLYTIRTLRHFSRMHPNVQLVLVIGADQLRDIEQWYEWENLVREFALYVYPRYGIDSEEWYVKYSPYAASITLLQAPLVTVSSTFIREGLAAGKNMNGFLV
ncbi:MAG: nicotinate (nicotinamide) nucleotide adenylyltransferase [Bacteroidales bacterium]|nr:nicotinate (nicotinamide) nucleotide adenylyltransferase [Bacteroidales bacterium]